MDAFFLTPKHRAIEQVVFDTLIQYVLIAASPLDWTVICANNESFTVWVEGTLQLQHFCRDNEVWDLKYKSCVCRHDKTCWDSANGTVNYGNIIAAICIAVALMALILVNKQLLTETKGNNTAYKKLPSR
jgi:hypothetical protein